MKPVVDNRDVNDFFSSRVAGRNREKENGNKMGWVDYVSMQACPVLLELSRETKLTNCEVSRKPPASAADQ